MELTTLAFLAFLLIAAISFYFFSHQHSSSKQLPPSPTGIPIIGHIHLLASYSQPVHQILWELSKKFGPLVHLRLISTPTLVVSSLASALEILKTNDVTFSSRPPLTFARIMLPDDLIFAAYGERWRELRKLCTLELFTTRRVSDFSVVRQAEVAVFVEKLSNNLGKAVNMSSELTKLTMGIMQAIIFGKIRSSEVEEFLRLMHRSNELSGMIHIGDYVSWLKWLDFSVPEMKKLSGKFHHFLQEHIDKHRHDATENSSENFKSFLDVILSLDGISDLTIRCVLLDAVAAGLDTTANAVEWALVELMRHPKVLEKVQQELDSVLPENTAVVSEVDIPKLKFLHAVVKESFRLHPPAPLMIPRQSTRKCELNLGYLIPAKTLVLVNLYAIGRDPKVWENPCEFLPERMLDENNKAIELLTFGYGRRSCPGMNLGSATVHLMLANLLFKFNWKTPGDRLVDIEETVGFTLIKARPLELIPIPRK